MGFGACADSRKPYVSKDTVDHANRTAHSSSLGLVECGPDGRERNGPEP
jgi:hypothetical protein